MARRHYHAATLAIGASWTRMATESLANRITEISRQLRAATALTITAAQLGRAYVCMTLAELLKCIKKRLGCKLDGRQAIANRIQRRSGFWGGKPC